MLKITKSSQASNYLYTATSESFSEVRYYELEVIHQKA